MRGDHSFGRNPAPTLTRWWWRRSSQRRRRKRSLSNKETAQQTESREIGRFPGFLYYVNRSSGFGFQFGAVFQDQGKEDQANTQGNAACVIEIIECGKPDPFVNGVRQAHGNKGENHGADAEPLHFFRPGDGEGRAVCDLRTEVAVE